jgi:uncharacterized protein involved in response to NO
MATSEAAAVEGLPEQWRRAYGRDRLGLSPYADPAPERRAARVLAAFILTGLCFLALPGTLLGVWNLISISEHQASNAVSPAWIQAHGQAQLFGWVGTFILGISLYSLPKFRGHPLKHFGAAWIVWASWTAGVTWRWWVGVSARNWRPGLVASGVLELVAYALVIHTLFFVPGGKSQEGEVKKAPSDLGSWLGIFGFAALGLALLINLGVCIYVAATASLPVYPALADRTFLLIALWGFAVPIAWGYSTKFVTIFLGLETPLHHRARWLCAGIAGLVVSAILRQFVLADALILALTVTAIWTLRISRPSARPPKLLGVYRLYPIFVRLAYAWLGVGAVLGLLADVIPAETGLGGASRHAVTVGFLATLIFAIGPRILPSFLSGRELYSSRLMAASLWALNAGCLLRVSSEAVAYSAGGAAWTILPVSALLELSAVVIFVANLGMTLKQPIPAWFGPQGVSATLPLYWYVTSFPKTRPMLIRAGLKTLARVRELPRSLSLAEAAAADGADLGQMLDDLRDFFSQRQPRRVGRVESQGGGARDTG